MPPASSRIQCSIRCDAGVGVLQFKELGTDGILRSCPCGMSHGHRRIWARQLLSLADHTDHTWLVAKKGDH